MLTIILKIVLILALVGIDQAIKAWATAVLLPVAAMPLIPGLVELRYVLNSGAAFSMMSGQQTFLILFTGACLLVLGVLVFRCPKGWLGKVGSAGLLLVFAGGVGNLIDRVLNGVVVDYINLLFMNFAVFNFADICVCVGVGLIVLDVLLDEFTKAKPAPAPKEENDGTV